MEISLVIYSIMEPTVLPEPDDGNVSLGWKSPGDLTGAGWEAEPRACSLISAS